MRSKYITAKSRNEKQYLGKLMLSSKIIQKYKIRTKIQKSVVYVKPQRLVSKNKGIVFEKKTKASHIFVKKNIEEFFMNNGTLDPGKKCIKQ